MAATNKLLVLTDAHRKQIQAAMAKLATLRRELAGLQEAGIMDCKDYSELCEFVNGSLERKLNYFFPRGNITRARKGGDE